MLLKNSRNFEESVLGFASLPPSVCMKHPGGEEPRQFDSDAEFLVLLSRHERSLAACVHALVPNWQDAEEVLQETRVTLWRKFADFQHGTDFLAWSRTVARYVARTHLRQNGMSRRVLREDVAQALFQEMTRPVADEDCRQTALSACTQELGQEAQDLLRRFYSDGVKIAQIATDLGRSLHGTYMALSRIRRALMECIELRLRQEERA